MLLIWGPLVKVEDATISRPNIRFYAQNFRKPLIIQMYIKLDPEQQTSLLILVTKAQLT